MTINHLKFIFIIIIAFSSAFLGISAHKSWLSTPQKLPFYTLTAVLLQSQSTAVRIF